MSGGRERDAPAAPWGRHVGQGVLPGVRPPLDQVATGPDSWQQRDRAYVLAQLAARGLRNTAARRAVVETILDTRGQFTARQLHAVLGPQEIGRATVYRALELLVELGVIDRLHVDERCSSYVVCADRHHNHLICERCGAVREVGDARIEQVIREVSADAGLRPREHRLEIVGVCDDCATVQEGDRLGVPRV